MIHISFNSYLSKYFKLVGASAAPSPVTGTNVRKIGQAVRVNSLVFWLLYRLNFVVHYADNRHNARSMRKLLTICVPL